MAREAHMAKVKPIEYRTGFMVSPEKVSGDGGRAVSCHAQDVVVRKADLWIKGSPSPPTYALCVHTPSLGFGLILGDYPNDLDRSLI